MATFSSFFSSCFFSSLCSGIRSAPVLAASTASSFTSFSDEVFSSSLCSEVCSSFFTPAAVSACFTSVASSCFSCVLCSMFLSFCNTSANSEAARFCLYDSRSGATHNRCHWDGLTLLGCNFLPSMVAAHRHSPDLARNTATRWMRFRSTSCSLPPKISTFRSGLASAMA